MPKVELDSIEQVNRTGYPPPFNEDVAGRWYRRLAPATGLTDFGVSYVTLKPGAWSSQRHWHNSEDEFLVLLSGEAMLVEDEGCTLLQAGDCAAWPKGSTNGHHLRNEGEQDCVFICVGGGKNEGGGYSDIDLMFTPEGTYVHKDGSPYRDTQRPA
jgi:uncharacterized cupin superfamily protein